MNANFSQEEIFGLNIYCLIEKSEAEEIAKVSENVYTGGRTERSSVSFDLAIINRFLFLLVVQNTTIATFWLCTVVFYPYNA